MEELAYRTSRHWRTGRSPDGTSPPAPAPEARADLGAAQRAVGALTQVLVGQARMDADTERIIGRRHVTHRSADLTVRVPAGA